MAWFEGLSSLKGQLSNLAKGVLTDDAEEDNPTSSHDQRTHNSTPPQKKKRPLKYSIPIIDPNSCETVDLEEEKDGVSHSADSSASHTPQPQPQKKKRPLKYSIPIIDPNSCETVDLEEEKDGVSHSADSSASHTPQPQPQKKKRPLKYSIPIIDPNSCETVDLEEEKDGVSHSADSSASHTPQPQGPEVSSAPNPAASDDGWNEAFLATDTFIGQDVPITKVTSPQPGPSRQEDEDGSVLSKGFASLLSLGKTPDINDQLRALQEENRALREDNESKTREIRSYARIITDLESTVAVSQDVNSNLSTGMEELDLQHQQAIEQVLNVKEDTQKLYDQLQLRYAELESRFVEMEKELNKPKPQLACTGTDPSVEHETEKEDLLHELEERDRELEMVEQENERLNELLKILNADLENAREALPSIPENSEELELKVSSLEGDNLVLREVRTNLETEVAASREHIAELSRRVNELNAMLKNQENVMIDYNKLTETNSQQEQQLIHNRKYIEKLQNDLQHSREESSVVIEGLKRELEDKKAYVGHLEEGSEASNVFLQEENAKLTKKIASLVQQTHSLDEQLERAQKDNETKDKKLCELVFDSNAQKEEFNVYREKSESDYELIKKELSSLKEKLQESGVTEASVKVLERELENAKEKARNLELELKLMKGDEELLNLEIQSLNETKQKLQSELEDNNTMKEAISEKEQTICSLETKCKTMEVAFEESRKVLEVEVDSLRNSLSEFQINNDLNRETVLELKKQLEDKEDELFKQSELYFGKLSQIEAELSAKTNENISMAAKLKELEMSSVEVEKNREQLERAASEIEVVRKEKSTILEEVKQLRNELELFKMTENQMDVLVARNKEYASKLEEEDEKNRSLQNENDELRRSLELKHAESIGYNSEIQRLNNALLAETSKLDKLAKDSAQVTNSYSQLQCQVQEKTVAFEQVDAEKNKQVSALTQEVETLKNQLEYVSQLLKSVERGEGEGQGEAPPQQKSCANGCTETQEELGRLTTTLLREQTENKLLKNSIDELNEKLSKDNAQLAMLKDHLFGIEESYTNELMVAQNKIEELSSKLSQADDRARTSSTAYTSANIRANQQVESLSQQVKLLTEHKEKLEGELSKAEDNYQKQSASIINLQAVLHQFQREKQSDIEFETERIRQKLLASIARNEELQMELKALQEQLFETKKGLAAANRLSDQLDLKVQLIESLTSQVNELNRKLKAEEAKVQTAYTNVEGKVDRNLVKNLVTGYVCSPPNSKLQILRVIAQVLDLNREDRIKVGLEPGTSGQSQSLSEAFIRFLESESQPKPIVLLNRPTSTPPSRKTSQSGPVTLLLPSEELPTLPHFTVGRNSAGSILKDVMKESNT